MTLPSPRSPLFPYTTLFRSRAATCITVRNTVQKPCSVHVHHCDLQIGHQQQGILLVNVARASVENNTLGVYEKPDRLKLPILLRSEEHTSELQSRENLVCRL